MVTGHYPFSDDEIDDVYETMFNILENTVVYYDSDEISEPLYNIFCLCCNPDVYSRVTIPELMNHEFFEGIDWNVITLPKSKKKPNLSIHTSLLKNNANAALLANSNNNNNNNMMSQNQIYIASPTCLNSPIRINSPSCLYTPLNLPTQERTENPVITSNSAVVNSPLVKAANPILSAGTSPARKSPLIKAAAPSISLSPKIRPTSPTTSNNNIDFKKENAIFSPKASKLINNISFASNNDIINNITPRKPTVNINKNFHNDEYINSPLHQSTSFSPKNKKLSDNAENVDNVENHINTKNKEKENNITLYPIISPLSTPTAIKNNSSNNINNIEDELNLNSSLKRKNILFSDKEINNNEFISDKNTNIKINNSESSLEIYHKRLNSSESSDDETKSNCTLTNESEKEFNDQSSLIEENTLILNNVADTSNTSIYKTWDSEHSHILTF